MWVVLVLVVHDFYCWDVGTSFIGILSVQLDGHSFVFEKMNPTALPKLKNSIDC